MVRLTDCPAITIAVDLGRKKTNKHRTKKLLVRSTCVGANMSYFHKQIDKTLIRQILQELPDQGHLFLQKR